MDADEDDRRWRKAYAVVLGALAVTVALLTVLSKVSW